MMKGLQSISRGCRKGEISVIVAGSGGKSKITKEPKFSECLEKYLELRDKHETAHLTLRPILRNKMDELLKIMDELTCQK